MANQIGQNGITIETYQEILEAIINGTATVPGLKQIFGEDINTDSNSPDGQWINIFALAKLDILQLIVASYNAKDPDQAVGSSLDAVSQLCGITRRGGTYTKTQVVVTTVGAVSLVGLDDPAGATPFTVQDSNGNQFQLIASVTTADGANTLNFQAAEMGAVQAPIGTLTIPVTIIPGITSVNNAALPYENGINQETDAQLRIRRQKSVGLPAQGAIGGLYGGLYSVTALVQAVIYENTTSAVDANGVPAHGIWVISDGGADADVADMIYKYRNAGCPMKGATTRAITQADGSSFTVAWDKVATQNLYVKFHLASISGGAIDTTAAVNGLVALSSYSIYQAADITTIGALLRQVNPDLVVSSCEVSGDGSTWVNSVLPNALNKKFVLTAGNVTLI